MGPMKAAFANVLRPLSALAILGAAACGTGGQSQVPRIVFESPNRNYTVTTNNLLSRNLQIQGRIENGVDSNGAAIQVINYLGAFPNLAPGALLSVDGAGNFSLTLQDLLVNASYPFLQGSGGNAIVVRATNQHSPLDQAGNPIPSSAAITLTVNDQIEFTNPVYASVGPSPTFTVDTTCDLQTSNVISGTFALPAGTSDAATVISNAEVVVRAQADALADPLATGTDVAVKPFTPAADGSFSVTVDDTGWTPAYDPATPLQSDSNYFVRFTTTSPEAIPGPGDFGTFPFQNCLY